jgi:hypothetical protein
MRNWLNPLPAETVIGAIVGAILGSLLERNDYLNISDWLHSFFVLQFVFLILLFGLGSHFYCAACYLQKPNIGRWALASSLLALLIVLFMYPKRVGLGPDAEIVFLPHEYNVLMAGVLLLWLLTLRTLTILKRLLTE